MRKSLYRFLLFSVPIIILILFVIAGFLLGYRVNVYVLAAITRYEFSITKAIGIWLIGLAISLLTLLVSILVDKVLFKSLDNK